VPVEIHQPNPSPFLLLQQFAVPLLQPFATAGIVLVFVIFFLLQREDLRDRFIRLAGAGDLRRTTVAMDDAASRLSRYLLTQTAINTSFGVLVGTGLWFIGVPHPVLWGILGMLLRFVPYIGPVIAAALPVIVALAVDPGWAMLLWAMALFLVVELAIGQVIEPWLYGHSTGLSGIAVVVAAAFWTLLWGTRWTAIVDAIDDVPRCPRPACRAFTVSRGASRRPTCIGAGGSLLPTNARRGSRRSSAPG
jgi:predicted PurR-regulated permease PerM